MRQGNANTDPIAGRKAFFQRPDVQALAGSQDLPAPIAQWLGRLALFYGVPFDNLVADSGMLPPESLRFFYVDPNWINAIVDGALSIGGATSQAQSFREMSYGKVRESVTAAASVERKRLRNEVLPGDNLPAPPASGLLLRSALVSGWPGLEIKAYADAAGATQLNTLRMDHMAPDVLLCLFDAVPLRVDICEPSEGLQFGVEDPLSQGNPPTVELRGLGYGNYTSGAPIGTNTVPVVMRDAAKGVLNIAQMQQNLQSALQGLTPAALPASTSTDPDPLTPGGFAVQMIKAPEILSYLNNGAGLSRAEEHE